MIKTLLRSWSGNVFLFDVKIIEKRKKHYKVLAEGRALVSTKKVNGKYPGHCCLVGEEEYTEESNMKEVVFACIKRARLLQNQVINPEGNSLASKEDMIYVNVEEH